MTEAVSPEVAELRNAILGTEATEQWRSEDLEVFDLVQYSLVGWADDLERSLRRITDGLEVTKTKAASVDQGAVDELEVALSQIVSGRDKIVAIAALALGVPSLRLHKKGVRFAPSEGALKSRLSDIGTVHPGAGRLKAQLDALADHTAVDLRNQITHALSPIGEVTEDCWIRVAHLDENGDIVVWSRGLLYPEHTLDQGDIRSETIWRWALACAEQAHTLLMETINALAELIRQVGAIEPPQAVYRRPEGTIVLQRP